MTMLPKQAHKALDADTPDLNPVLAAGIARTHMQKAEEFLDAIFRWSATSFPEGLKYVGCKRCTPLEEYREQLRSAGKKTNRDVYDTARTDLYRMRYYFQYRDDPPFNIDLNLPYVGEAGMFYVSGSRYALVPVLANRVISIENLKIFTRLLKDKITYNRLNYPIIVDGYQVIGDVFWAMVYKNPKSQKRPTGAYSALAHYLMSKYGFTGMFQKYVGITPVVGTFDTITRDKYPQQDWVIIHSQGHRPKGSIIRNPLDYRPSNIVVAIKRSEYNAVAQYLVTSFFYIVDLFSNQIQAQSVDDPREWIKRLGQLLAAADKEAAAYEEMLRHLQSLDTYMDVVTYDKLKLIGMPCENLYDLFFLIIRNFQDWHLEARDRVTTMYDKELNILEFAFFDIIVRINELSFELGNNERLNQKKIDAAAPGVTVRGFDTDNLKKLFRSRLSAGLIHQLPKQKPYCESASTSGDNYALSITNVMVPQSESSPRNKKRGRATLKDATKQLHASIAEVGNYIALPKAHPDGRHRLNLCALVAPDGMIVRNPKFIDLINETQRKILLVGQQADSSDDGESAEEQWHSIDNLIDSGAEDEVAADE